MSNLTSEDIEAIAKRIVEITSKNVDTTPRNKTPLTDIASKYRSMMHKKYDVTYNLESCIRTTACLMAGRRYCSSLQGEELEKACEYMEYIYQTIQKTSEE